MFYNDDARMVIVNTALSNDGQGGGGMTFTDPKAIAVLQKYFANPDNSVIVCLIW